MRDERWLGRTSTIRKGNRLFEALGPSARERLRPYVALVEFDKGRVLAEPGETCRHAFFPLNGMISMLASTDDGQTLEVAMVGHEGFVGVPIVLEVRTSPYRVLVQIECTAVRISADAFAREFSRCEDLHGIALTYVHGLMQQLVQSAVCHTFHTLMQRLCRWLLASRACVHSNTIELTQEFIAQMLGASRPKVSQALVALEEQRVIHQGHGRIHIVDAAGLERSSCDCYRASLRDESPSLRQVR